VRAPKGNARKYNKTKPCIMKTKTLLILLASITPSFGVVAISNFDTTNASSLSTSYEVITNVGNSLPNPPPENGTREVFALGFLHGGLINPSVGVMQITQIQLGLSNFTGGVNPTVRIFSDSGSNTPGTLLSNTTVSSSANSTSPAVYTFNVSGSLAMTASQLFWVVVSKGNMANSPGTGAFDWSIQESAPQEQQINAFGYTDEPSGFTYVGFRSGTINYDGVNYPALPSSWSELNPVEGAPAIAIVIPEPSAALLGAFGVLGLMRRRRA
jgi:hypothetical protein